MGRSLNQNQWKAGTPKNPIRVQHRTQPSEPFAREGQFGLALRITPAYRTIPAQAFCQWEDFTTWEKLTDLVPVELDD
jgi:hypothetical protein